MKYTYVNENGSKFTTSEKINYLENKMDCLEEDNQIWLDKIKTMNEMLSEVLPMNHSLKNENTLLKKENDLLIKNNNLLIKNNELLKKKWKKPFILFINYYLFYYYDFYNIIYILLYTE